MIDMELDPLPNVPFDPIDYEGLDEEDFQNDPSTSKRFTGKVNELALIAGFRDGEAFGNPDMKQLILSCLNKGYCKDSVHQIIQDYFFDIQNTLLVLSKLPNLYLALLAEYAETLFSFVNVPSIDGITPLYKQVHESGFIIRTKRTAWEAQEVLMEIFDLMPATTSELTVWRAIHEKSIDALRPQKGYMSTSLSLEPTFDFFDHETGCCIMRIHIQPGTKIIPILGLSSQVAYDQMEIVIPGNGILTQNFITNVTYQNDPHCEEQVYKVYDMTYTPPTVLKKRKRPVEWELPYQSHHKKSSAVRSDLRRIIHASPQLGEFYTDEDV